MLTDAQIDALADKVNAKVNIPIIGERVEKMLIKFGLRRLDSKLQEVLPPEMYQMLEDASDGLSDEEAAVIKEKAVAYLNSKINVPILNEEQEKKLIEALLDEVMKAMRKGKSLNAA